MWRAGKANSSKLIFWWIACRCWSLWTTKHWVKEWFSVQRAILASKRVKYSVEHFGRGLESVCFVFSKCRRCQKWSDVQSNSQHQLRRCSQHEQRRAGEPPSPGGRLTLLSTYSPSSHLLSSSPSHLATYSPTLEIKKFSQAGAEPSSLLRARPPWQGHLLLHLPRPQRRQACCHWCWRDHHQASWRRWKTISIEIFREDVLGFVLPSVVGITHHQVIWLIWRGWSWWWRTECNCCFFFLF